MSINVLGPVALPGTQQSTLAVAAADTAPAAAVCSAEDLGFYDIPLHVAAIFITLVGSFIGIMIPILSRRRAAAMGESKVFEFFKHFGTGIIIATAFVHLLTEAIQTMANECLGELPFEPTPATLIMSASIIVFLIDFWGARAIRRKYGVGAGGGGHSHGPAPMPRRASVASFRSEKGMLPLDRDVEIALAALEDKMEQEKALFDLTLLEFGIVFHSLMVGIALGVAGGSSWLPLMIATTFHQTFEGMGLGSRIASINWPREKRLKKWLLVVYFSVVTSVGIGIGMGIHTTFDPNLPVSIWFIGTLECLSAGIILYAGLVNMLAHDWMSDDMLSAPNSKIFFALAAFATGNATMSFIGKFA